MGVPKIGRFKTAAQETDKEASANGQGISYRLLGIFYKVIE